MLRIALVCLGFWIAGIASPGVATADHEDAIFEAWLASVSLPRQEVVNYESANRSVFILLESDALLRGKKEWQDRASKRLVCALVEEDKTVGLPVRYEVVVMIRGTKSLFRLEEGTIAECLPEDRRPITNKVKDI